MQRIFSNLSLGALLLLCPLLISGTANWAWASGTSRYLYDVSPYDIDPKSWAIWRKSLSAKDWQEWCDDLNSQRWDWWRESMGPKNWRHWKEKMGPADKALWQESSQMHAGIVAREEQEEGAIHFKRKILQLKVGAQVVPSQKPYKAGSSQAETGRAIQTNGSVREGN